MREAPIYLDHNATTPLRPQAKAAMQELFEPVGNPSSVHGFGRAVRCAIEDAREQVASLAGVAPAGVVFTSGGSEANNLALVGCGRSRILVSAVEHDSVLAAVCEAERVPVDADGMIDLAALERLLAADSLPAMLSLMAANNETGVLQPVAEAAAIARRYGAMIHCDAVQAAGRVGLNMAALGIHMMTLSAHKLGGPMGAGALLLAEGADVAPTIRGGGQERRRRAGTENAPAIAGFGAAVAALGDGVAESRRLAGLRNDLECAVRARVPSVRIFGDGVARIANTSCLAMPGLGNETQVMALDLAGVAVSAGAACSSGKVGASHVLSAMGVDDAVARSAIRVSLGWTSTAADVGRFVEAWSLLYERTAAARNAA